MKIKCPAKINLFLNVIKKKETMHELVLINQTVDCYDEIEFMKTNTDKIEIKSKDTIPLDETNSIYKAANLMKEKYHIKDGFIFKVNKNIPTEAGLGGESSDAAGTLLLLNEVYHLNLTKEELSKIGIQIGSDVPFFLYSGYQMVTSIGDKITKPKNCNPYNDYIIIKPNFGLSTKEMFQKLDKKEFKKRKIQIPYNDFMQVVPNSIIKIKDYCNEIGCQNHTLSGSGSTYYIALEKKDNKLYKKVKEHFKDYEVKCVQNCDNFIITKE